MQGYGHVSDTGKKLLFSLLAPEPKLRPTAQQALAHDWFGQTHECIEELLIQNVLSTNSRRGSASPQGKRDQPLVLRHPLHDYNRYRLSNFRDAAASQVRLKIRLNKPLPQMGHPIRNNKDEESKVAPNTLVLNRPTQGMQDPSPQSNGVQYFKYIETFETDNKIKNKLI